MLSDLFIYQFSMSSTVKFNVSFIPCLCIFKYNVFIIVISKTEWPKGLQQIILNTNISFRYYFVLKKAEFNWSSKLQGNNFENFFTNLTNSPESIQFFSSGHVTRTEKNILMYIREFLENCNPYHNCLKTFPFLYHC